VRAASSNASSSSGSTRDRKGADVLDMGPNVFRRARIVKLA